MKILQLCKKFPYPPKDGETIAIFNLIKGFWELGQELTVIAMCTPKHRYDEKYLTPEIKRLALFNSVYVDTTVRAWPAFKNLFSSKSYNIARFESKDFEEKIKFYLSKKKYDIIQLEGLYLTPYIPLIRSMSDARIVMRAHNVEFEIWERMAKNQGISPKKLYLQFLTRRMKNFEINSLNEYDAMVTISDKDARNFQAMGFNKPSFTTPASVDLSQFVVENHNLEKQSVFYLGGLDWLPNQEGLKWFLEEVWPKIHQKYPQLPFYIAGRHAPKWIKKLKGSNIHYLGEVESASEFMNSKHIMIVPLFSGSGMRIKIIEAMALCKPIVATSIAAEGIEYTDGKNILIANDSETFIDSIIKCVEDYDFGEDIGINARLFVNTAHNNRNLVEALIKFYENEVL